MFEGLGSRLRLFGVAALASPLCAAAADAAPAQFPDHIVGDIGGMAYASGTPIRGESNSLLPLPYAYFDYERFFARIDTFGLKGCRMGYGQLELVGRVNVDRIKTDTAALRGISERKNSAPAGIGTYQLTPIGAFFAYAFHDFSASHGNLYELSYAAKLEFDRIVVYPQVGLDRRSSGWLGYYYGVSAAESAASGYRAYRPGAGTTPYAVLMLETHIAGEWYGDLELRRDWLPTAASDSPLLKDKTRDSAFLALAYRFK